MKTFKEARVIASLVVRRMRGFKQAELSGFHRTADVLKSGSGGPTRLQPF